MRTALLLTLTLVAAGCAARGGVPRPFPGAATPPSATATPPAVEPPAPDAPGVPAPPPAIVPPLLTTALALRGTAYRNGGSEPTEGFDCSGFVQWVFAQHGTPLPREVRDQFKAGRDVDDDEVQAGDLVFFETVSRGASHVGIALGDGTFVHAPSSRGVVRVERYTSDYWSKRWVGARRIVEADVGVAD